MAHCVANVWAWGGGESRARMSGTIERSVKVVVVGMRGGESVEEEVVVDMLLFIFFVLVRYWKETE